MKRWHRGWERRTAASVCLVASLIGLSGCARAMHDDSRTKPLAESAFFTNRMSARTPPSGTVARGQLQTNEVLSTGRSAGAFAKTSPIATTRQSLERGQERYEIYCTPCHDSLGTGRGMIVQR